MHSEFHIPHRFQYHLNILRKMGNQYQMPILNLDVKFCDLLKTENLQFDIKNFAPFLFGLWKKQGFNIHACPYKAS